MRGRILSCASSLIGRPSSSISIVTFAAPSPSVTGSTFLTLPTSTPAIRTGDFGFRLFTSSKNLELVRVRERVRLSEAEVGEQADDDEREDALRGRRSWHVRQVVDAELARLVGPAREPRQVVVGDTAVAARADLARDRKALRIRVILDVALPVASGVEPAVRVAVLAVLAVRVPCASIAGW